jgi:cobalamin-dependent methionine synthase I
LESRQSLSDAGNVIIILKEKKLTAKGIYGIFPANQVNDDDIELTDENGKALQTFLTLRQQSQKQRRQILPCRTLLLQRFW